MSFTSPFSNEDYVILLPTNYENAVTLGTATIAFCRPTRASVFLEFPSALLGLYHLLATLPSNGHILDSIYPASASVSQPAETQLNESAVRRGPHLYPYPENLGGEHSQGGRSRRSLCF
jgi:hypothetical protein